MRKEVIGNATLYCGDCLDILPSVGVADAIITDPPYFQVKGDYWDNEWDSDEAFLAWMTVVVGSLAAVLVPNGSMYLFASPQMAARVEAAIRTKFLVLNNITWNKGARRKGAAGSGVDVTALRSFWQASSERVIFAEHYGSDESAYTDKRDEAARTTFGKYITAIRKKHGLTMNALTAAVGAHGAVNHGGACSNWEAGYNVPTQEHYAKLQATFPGCFDRTYDDLRDEYEEMKAEHEALRRPFYISDQDQWSDVWDFDPVSPYPGKHVCEKPITMLQHMVKASSRPGGTVLDAFMGSGSTGHAALLLNRRFIGIERDAEHFDAACIRIENAQRQERLFA